MTSVASGKGKTMSRYIDADALMKTLKISDDCKHCEQCEDDYFCSMSGDFVNACEAINEAPSIDIVRCKECKHAEVCSQNVAMRETYDMYEKIDYCSYGEREGERWRR